MKNLRKAFPLAFALAGAALVTGCSDDTIDVGADMANDYVKSFIEKYGVPQEGHDFSMAKLGTVTVRTDKPTDFSVICTIDGKNYVLDKAFAITGEKTLSFDAPRGVDYVSVIANGNRAYTARLGDVVSVDCTRKSRGNEGSDTKINVTNYKALAYDAKMINGIEIQVRDLDSEIISASTKSGFSRYMLGSELLQYVGDDNKNVVGVVSEEYTSRHTNEAIHVLSLKSYEDRSIEFGRVYGNKPLLKESDSFTLVPLGVNGAMSPNTQPKVGWIGKFSYTVDLHKWGHDLTIDYSATSSHDNGIDGGKGGVISSEVLGVTDFAEFRNILNDKELKKQLETYANAQKTYNMPVPNDMHAGDNRFPGAILEPYEKDNAYKFYSQWCAYINAWINAQSDDVKAQFPDLKFVKEYMAFKKVLFKEGSMPSVTEVSPGKFKIEFFDSQLSNTMSSVDADANSEGVIDPGHTYNLGTTDECNLKGEEDNEDRIGTEFAYYIRDLNEPDKIVTTTDKSRVIMTHRHSSHTAYNGKYNDWEHQIYMVDFDGDGTFNDFVFMPQLYVYGDGNYIGWRLVAEDLGSSDDSDFNDLVANISVSQDGNDAQTIRVTPRAAGGIYPLYLMFNDTRGNTYFMGEEIHEWLQQPAGKIYNTGETDLVGYKGSQARFDYDLLVQTHKFQLNGELANTDMGENSTLGGFWVLVDKNNALDGKVKLSSSSATLLTPEVKAIIDADKDIYQVNNDPKYGVNNAVVPQMILVTNDWCWPQERVDIGVAYGKFSEWVANRDTKWYGSDAEGVDMSKVTKPQD